jgi:hypothetical protein
VGRKEVEDAVLQLDMLTKEENLMIAARNMEVTHHVDRNVEANKVLTENIDDNVKATKVLAEDVSDNVKVIEYNVTTTKDGSRRPLSVFIHVLTSQFAPK